jgi:murein DD-endopeptidase MepM/ murein hydrolase activator NlpD
MLALRLCSSFARVALAATLALAPLTQVRAGDLPGDAAGAPPATQLDAAPARVFLAAPVGQVTVDRMADIVGQRMYAVRGQASGSAAVVSFSATKPRPVLALSVISAAPLLRGRLTSTFGAPRPALGGGLRAHAGIDLAAPAGSPVAASMDGRVGRATWAQGYGLLVTLEHAGGLETRYAHLSAIGVVPGQVVHKGEVIGLVGSTGHSTGPHLHYEVRQNGRAVNPLLR